MRINATNCARVLPPVHTYQHNSVLARHSSYGVATITKRVRDGCVARAAFVAGAHAL